MSTDITTLVSAINISFIFFCAVLVIFMQVGFALLEAGLNSYKNAANILFKNFIDFCVGAICYFFVGYLIMYPEARENIIFYPMGNWNGSEIGVPIGFKDAQQAIHWFYSMVFATTATTIVSGAIAGRMRFSIYIAYSAFLTSFIYPIVGFVLWSSESPFNSFHHDLAGSLVVHSVGGATALAAVRVLGKRREVEFFTNFEGHHNLVYVILGGLLLWIGWYGFNAGSIGDLVSYDSEKSFTRLSNVVVNTTLCAVISGITVMFITRFLQGEFFDLKKTVNGVLGGLVAVTASADIANNVFYTILIGFTSGLLVVVCTPFIDKKVDDAVGAISVHGICGIWGGVAVGVIVWLDTTSVSLISIDINHKEITLYNQVLISFLIPFCVYVCMFLFFFGMNKIVKLRISESKEIMGLDLSEHGVKGYRMGINKDIRSILIRG